jgi:hypothetical protein
MKNGEWRRGGGRGHLPLEHLWRRIDQRAEGLARANLAGLRIKPLREAKVTDLAVHTALRQIVHQQVARFDVAVQDRRRVVVQVPGPRVIISIRILVLAERR